jgi:hypothetical protein
LIRVVRLIRGTGIHPINRVARINHIRPDCVWLMLLTVRVMQASEDDGRRIAGGRGC